MSTAKMVGFVGAFAGVGAFVGGLLGFGLGLFAPDLYRAWFRPGPYLEDKPYDPLQLGIGLGIIQGLVAGFVLGCVVLIVSAIRNKPTSS
ncbi:MAG TPA: hypothetical protein VJ835_04500 [Fimbriimonadaceae bacterium]|nr:hypothetical protein [Fimbriimonadaceae bacterium]